MGIPVSAISQIDQIFEPESYTYWVKKMPFFHFFFDFSLPITSMYKNINQIFLLAYRKKFLKIFKSYGFILVWDLYINKSY